MDEIALIGAPTSAGAHWAGQEKAPAAFRRAGVAEMLRAAGRPVRDLGDLPVALFATDPANRHAGNAAAVAGVAASVADLVAGAPRVLVLGGDCTITVGVVEGLKRRYERLALVYLDGHTDLNTPARSKSGILDSMGLARLLGDCEWPAAGLGTRPAQLAETDVVLFGFEPDELNAEERDRLAGGGFASYPAPAIRGRVGEAAAEALARAERNADAVLVHFDVDVIDFVDFPVADVPQFNSGLTLAETAEALAVLLRSELLAGLVVTEFNPDRDLDGRYAERLVDVLVAALASG